MEKIEVGYKYIDTLTETVQIGGVPVTITQSYYHKYLIYTDSTGNQWATSGRLAANRA